MQMKVTSFLKSYLLVIAPSANFYLALDSSSMHVDH